MGAGDRGAARRRARAATADALAARIALMPLNQLQMMKLLVNETVHAQGLHATQVLGTVFDGAARHTPRGLRLPGAAPPRGLQGRGRGPRRAVRDRPDGRPTDRDDPRAAAGRRAEPDRGGRLRRRLGGGDRRAGRRRLRAPCTGTSPPRRSCSSRSSARSARARSARCAPPPRELRAGAPAAERLEHVLATFARRALRNPRLAWALIAEPVDPLVDAERLAYRCATRR